MVEFICVMVIIAFAFGQWHVASLNGYFWFLDGTEGTQQYWTFDTFLSTMLFPIALFLCSAELYFLFKI